METIIDDLNGRLNGVIFDRDCAIERLTTRDRTIAEFDKENARRILNTGDRPIELTVEGKRVIVTPEGITIVKA